MTEAVVWDDPVLGRVRVCRICGEEWPFDSEFYYFRSNGQLMVGCCKACWFEKYRPQRRVRPVERCREPMMDAGDLCWRTMGHRGYHQTKAYLDRRVRAKRVAKVAA